MTYNEERIDNLLDQLGLEWFKRKVLGSIYWVDGQNQLLGSLRGSVDDKTVHLSSRVKKEMLERNIKEKF